MVGKERYNTLKAMYYSDDIDHVRIRILEILKSLDGDGCTEKQLILWIQSNSRIVKRVLRTLEDLHEVYRFKGKGRAVLWDYNLFGRPNPTNHISPLTAHTKMGTGQSCNHCRSFNNGPTRDHGRCWRCDGVIESTDVTTGTAGDEDAQG